MSCRLLNLLSHLFIAVKVEDVCDQIQCILVILDFGVQIREVESIGKIFLVDLAEVFVSP